MFLGKYFPPSMVTKLRNEITNFHQRPDESLFEVWEHYKLSIDRCPNHNMLPGTQIDTFYNGLTLRHRDTINAAAGGTFMKRPTVGNTQNVYAAGAYQAYQASVHQPQIHQPQVVTTNEFTNFMKANDAILKNMQTNMTSLINSNIELKNMFGQFMKMNTGSSLGSRTLPGNTITNPKEDMKGITTRSGTAYQGPTIPTTTFSSLVTKDMVHPTNNRSTEDVQPPVVQTESPILNSELVISLIIEPVASPELKICEAKTDKSSIDKPSEVELKDLPPHLEYASLEGDDKFPVIIAKDLSVEEKTALITVLKSHKRTIACKLSDIKAIEPEFCTHKILMEEDFEPVVQHQRRVNPKIRNVIENEVLKLLDAGLIYLISDSPWTSRYSTNYNDITANRIDVIDMACEEYSQEVLGFSNVIASGNPTLYYDPIVSTTSPTLTPFGNSDFHLEEVDAFLSLEDDPTSPEVDQSYFDSEGDILLLEAFLNDDPSLPPPNQGNYLP
nr:reverse transcriptase domain-containing protein [Tanacetum cinerariifolium]